MFTATRYGRGSYFAVNSAYSANYAEPNAQGHKYILQARVITGDWIQGNSSMKSAPLKPNSNETYDSVVDDDDNTEIFVVFYDTSAYPEYIIKFQ